VSNEGSVALWLHGRSLREEGSAQVLRTFPLDQWLQLVRDGPMLITPYPGAPRLLESPHGPLVALRIERGVESWAFGVPREAVPALAELMMSDDYTALRWIAGLPDLPPD
jgi:hypothetical protein